MKNSDNTSLIVITLLGLGFFAYLIYASRKEQEPKQLGCFDDEILTVKKLKKILDEYKTEQQKMLDIPPSMI